MRTKKRENAVSSDGRNFFQKRPISNLKSSAETWVYALPYMRKSPKISILTVISAMQGKPVHKGGWAKGGQGGPHKRPWWQVKTVPGGKKNGAKSILGSNRFGKVPGEFFLFSACTLVSIYRWPVQIKYEEKLQILLQNLQHFL